MNNVFLFTWQSLRTGTSHTRQVWLTDVHAFETLEEAIEVGYQHHIECTEHKMHRISCMEFNPETLERVAQTPVFYIVKEVTNANTAS